MKVVLLLGVLFTFGISNAQDSLIVRLSFIDKKSGEPVPNVNATISIPGSKSFFKTSHGNGTIQFKVPKDIKVSAAFTHAIYESNDLQFTTKSREDTIALEVLLVSERIQYVGEVIVKPIGTPYVVFESDRISVADFEVLNDGKLILLTYPKRLKKGSDLLLAEGKTVLNSFHVPGVAEELIRDYRGNTHIVCEESVFGVQLIKGDLQISQIEKPYFLKYVMPIVDTNSSKMYFSNFSANYPAFDYFAYDLLDSTYRKIVNIQDDLMMEMFRAEYKWMDVRTQLWAKNKELETGIDAEIWVGANYFTKSIYYKELYAPLFHRNDSLFVFDYYADKLFTFNKYGDKLDSVEIYHHYQPKSTGWQKSLIQDHITGQIYARFEKDGNSFLGLIDTKTGEITERIKLEYKYVEKIAVSDNFVYYIYRPFESAQKKFLYKEELPYKFKASSVPGGDEMTEE